MPKKISVREFEAKVLDIEEIVIRVSAPVGDEVDDYCYERKAAGNQSTTDWIQGRLRPLLGGFEIEVVAGDYAAPHGRTRLETLRASYEK